RLYPTEQVWDDYLVWKTPPLGGVYYYNHPHCFRGEEINDLFEIRAVEASAAEWARLRPTPAGQWRTGLEGYRLNARRVRNNPDSRLRLGYLLGKEGRPEAEWEIIWRGPAPADAGHAYAWPLSLCWRLVLPGGPAAASDVAGGGPGSVLAVRRVDPFVL